MNRRTAIVALVAVPAAMRGVVVAAATPRPIALSGALLREFSGFQAAVYRAERSLLEFESGAIEVSKALQRTQRTFAGRR